MSWDLGSDLNHHLSSEFRWSLFSHFRLFPRYLPNHQLQSLVSLTFFLAHKILYKKHINKKSPISHRFPDIRSWSRDRYQAELNIGPNLETLWSQREWHVILKKIVTPRKSRDSSDRCVGTTCPNCQVHPDHLHHLVPRGVITICRKSRFTPIISRNWNSRLLQVYFRHFSLLTHYDSSWESVRRSCRVLKIKRSYLPLRHLYS